MIKIPEVLKFSLTICDPRDLERGEDGGVVVWAAPVRKGEKDTANQFNLQDKNSKTIFFVLICIFVTSL